MKTKEKTLNKVPQKNLKREKNVYFGLSRWKAFNAKNSFESITERKNKKSFYFSYKPKKYNTYQSHTKVENSTTF